jgi:protein-disulfide isomerase
LSGAIFTGTTNSAIVLIEYSDIECPFCQRQFSTKTVETIIEQHRIKTMFRNFPLSFHSTAQKAAEAIMCAGKQGKYIEFKDALFSAAIDSTDKKPTLKIISATAKKLQLNETTFTKCLSDGQSTTQVQSEMSE